MSQYEIMSDRWNPSRLRDLRLWLISERLPPDVSFDELAEVVEIAEENAELADLQHKLCVAEEENQELEEENQELQQENEDLRERLEKVSGAVQTMASGPCAA